MKMSQRNGRRPVKQLLVEVPAAEATMPARVNSSNSSG